MGRGTTLASAPLEIGGADYGATKRVNVCRSMWRGRVRAVTATGALGGAPYGATKCVRGVPKWRGAACEVCHWGPRWSSLWGHETCEGCAKVEGGGMRGLPLGLSVELPMGPRNV